MKKVITTIIILIIVFQISSCRFSKPLTSHLIKVDTLYYNSINKDTFEIIYDYNYFRISHYGLIGNYEIKKQFINKNELIKIDYAKYSSCKDMIDGIQKIKWKRLKFQNNLIKEKYLSIKKVRGTRGKLKFEKTSYYDYKGKLIKTIITKRY